MKKLNLYSYTLFTCLLDHKTYFCFRVITPLQIHKKNYIVCQHKYNRGRKNIYFFKEVKKKMNRLIISPHLEYIIIGIDIMKCLAA